MPASTRDVWRPYGMAISPVRKLIGGMAAPLIYHPDNRSSASLYDQPEQPFSCNLTIVGSCEGSTKDAPRRS